MQYRSSKGLACFSKGFDNRGELSLCYQHHLRTSTTVEDVPKIRNDIRLALRQVHMTKSSREEWTNITHLWSCEMSQLCRDCRTETYHNYCPLRLNAPSTNIRTCSLLQMLRENMLL
jgi:hypothetical protein